MRNADILEELNIDSIFTFIVSCATWLWSLTLKDEYKLRVFENSKYPEANILARSSNMVRVIKSRRLRGIGHFSRMEEGRSAVKI